LRIGSSARGLVDGFVKGHCHEIVDIIELVT
jgi:hypothetical protein